MHSLLPSHSSPFNSQTRIKAWRTSNASPTIPKLRRSSTKSSINIRKQMPVRAGGCFRDIFGLIRAIERIHTPMKGEPLRDFAVRGYDGTAFLEALALFATLPALKDLVLRL